MKCKKATRIGLLATGVVCLLLAVAGLIYWSYLMGPLRRYFELASMYPSVIERELWDTVQKDIDRTGGMHDSYGYVGSHGGKQWAARIISMLKEGTPIDACTDGPSHLDVALVRITNQIAGHTGEAWIDWWDQNRSKTQVEWWLDGFEQAGIPMDVPPSKENVVTLLRLLGAETNEWQISRHNAFRWLRDNDFDEREFKASDLPEDGADDVLRGLAKYAALKSRSPKGPGALDVGEPVRDLPLCLPLPFLWWFDLAVKSGIGLLLMGGAACLWLSKRKRRESAT